MKLLLTGFTPFGSESINPSYEALKRIENKNEAVNLKVVEVPTVFNQSIEKLRNEIEAFNPDIVICVGQAGGRYSISFERVAINVDDSRIKDNQGNQPIDQPIVTSGPNAYFTNLPIKSMVKTLRDSKIPAEVSNSAGTFVCNHLMYGFMHIIEESEREIRGGFIHVPFIHDQIINKKDIPSLALETITKAFEIIIDFISQTDLSVDVKMPFGKED
jgi:pyroglutamyl-peptidase